MGVRNETLGAGNVKVDSTGLRIIDAAEQLFAEGGYEGTTLRAIARQVGIREPSLYAHFPNKEAIYEAVIDRALSAVYNEINTWNRSGLTLSELFSIPRRLMTLHAQHPYAAQILLREYNSPSERISPKILQWLEQISVQSTMFADSLRDAHGPQPDRKHMVLSSILFTNMMLGFFASQGMQAKLLGEEYRPEELFEEQVQMVTRIFKSMLM